MEEWQSFPQTVLEQWVEFPQVPYGPCWCYFQSSKKPGSKLDSLGKHGGQLVDLEAHPTSKEREEESLPQRSLRPKCTDQKELILISGVCVAVPLNDASEKPDRNNGTVFLCSDPSIILGLWQEGLASKSRAHQEGYRHLTPVGNLFYLEGLGGLYVCLVWLLKIINVRG